MQNIVAVEALLRLMGLDSRAPAFSRSPRRCRSPNQGWALVTAQVGAGGYDRIWRLSEPCESCANASEVMSKT
jgi:hypothetical protein